MFTPPHHLYPPRPELPPCVYDYEQQFNGITFYTRVHQAGYTIAHYTAFVKPGEHTPTFLDTICTIQPDHALKCRRAISTHQYRQPLNVVRIPSPYPPTLLSCPPADDPYRHYRDQQSGRDPPRREPTPIPSSSMTEDGRVPDSFRFTRAAQHLRERTRPSTNPATVPFYLTAREAKTRKDSKPPRPTRYWRKTTFPSNLRSTLRRRDDTPSPPSTTD